MTNLGGDTKGTLIFKNEKDKSQRWGKECAMYIFKRGEKQILKVRKKLESSSTKIQNEERKSWRWGILIYKKKEKKTNLRGERKKTNLRGERKKGEKDKSPRWEKSGTEVWAAEAVAPLISLLETLAQICGLIQILILLPALVHWVSFNTPLFIIQSKRVLNFSFFDHHHHHHHQHHFPLVIIIVESKIILISGNLWSLDGLPLKWGAVRGERGAVQRSDALPSPSSSLSSSSSSVSCQTRWSLLFIFGSKQQRNIVQPCTTSSSSRSLENKDLLEKIMHYDKSDNQQSKSGISTPHHTGWSFQLAPLVRSKMKKC